MEEGVGRVSYGKGQGEHFAHLRVPLEDAEVRLGLRLDDDGRHLGIELVVDPDKARNLFKLLYDTVSERASREQF